MKRFRLWLLAIFAVFTLATGAFAANDPEWYEKDCGDLHHATEKTPIDLTAPSENKRGLLRSVVPSFAGNYEAQKAALVQLLQDYYTTQDRTDDPREDRVTARFYAEGLEDSDAVELAISEWMGKIYFNTLYDAPEQTFFIRTDYSWESDLQAHTDDQNGDRTYYEVWITPKTILPERTRTAEQVNALTAEYKAALDKACSECFGASEALTDLEKIVSAHDWLAMNCFYDPYVSMLSEIESEAHKAGIEAGNAVYTNALKAGDSKETAAEKARAAYDVEYQRIYDQLYQERIVASGLIVDYPEDEAVYTSYGALVNGKPVCQGYSLAFKAMLDRAGVPCEYVRSGTINHAWNMVQLNGNWYHVDCTWDDSKIRGQLFRDNLLLNDEDIIQTGHQNANEPETCCWTTENSRVAQSASFELPDALKDSIFPVYHQSGAFYFLKSDSGNGDELLKFDVSSNFANATSVPLEMTETLFAAAFDRQQGVIYFLGEVGEVNADTADGMQYLYAADISDAATFAGLVHAFPTEKVKITERNGDKFYYDYYTYGLQLDKNENGLFLYAMDGNDPVCEIKLKTQTTDSSMPVHMSCISAATSADELPGRTIRFERKEGFNGSFFALIVNYGQNGKMLGYTRAEGEGLKCLLLHDWDVWENAETVKIIVVSSNDDNYGDPLAEAFVLTENG